MVHSFQCCIVTWPESIHQLQELSLFRTRTNWSDHHFWDTTTAFVGERRTTPYFSGYVYEGLLGNLVVISLVQTLMPLNICIQNLCHLHWGILIPPKYFCSFWLNNVYLWPNIEIFCFDFYFVVLLRSQHSEAIQQSNNYRILYLMSVFERSFNCFTYFIKLIYFVINISVSII